jgi:hypothetical protein
MGGALPLAFTAALNPTLLTATMVMLLASEPRRLMSGFLLGAYTISISLGLVIAFTLEGTSAVTTTQHTLSPVADIVLGVLLVVVAYVLHRGRDRGRRRERADEAKEPRWRKMLDEGSPRTAFAVGLLLTLPGASYLAGMSRIGKAGASVPATALSVVLFCVIMLLLLELPLLGFAVAPDATRRAVGRFVEWVTVNGRTVAVRGALLIGALLVLRGVIALLAA